MAGRISTGQMFQRAQESIANARERHVETAEKVTTGKELVRPSQDPTGYMVAAPLKDDVSTRETMMKNASLANNNLAAADQMLGQLQEQVQRAHELAIAGAGTGGATDVSRTALYSEMRTLYDSMLTTLNMRFGNRTLLGGFKTLQPAFDREGGFQGDDGKIEVEIAPQHKMAMNLSARKVVLGEGQENGVNLLQLMQTLVEGFQKNDSNLVHSTLESWTKANDQISFWRSEVAGRMSAIEKSLSNQDLQNINSKDVIAKVEEGDAIKTLSNLARDQTVLQAAISSSQKILTQDPTDILFK